MNRYSIIKKTLEKLKISDISPVDLNDMIKICKESTEEDTVYSFVNKNIRFKKYNQEDVKVIFSRLLVKEKLHKLSKNHEKAFKKLFESFPLGREGLDDKTLKDLDLYKSPPPP